MKRGWIDQISFKYGIDVDRDGVIVVMFSVDAIAKAIKKAWTWGRITYLWQARLRYLR